MGTKKRSRSKAPSATRRGRVEILLEEIKDQNRATMEAVASLREEFKRDLERAVTPIHERLDAVELVVRKSSQDIQEIREEIRSLRSMVERIERSLDQKADMKAYADLERRVAALEARVYGS